MKKVSTVSETAEAVKNVAEAKSAEVKKVEAPKAEKAEKAVKEEKPAKAPKAVKAEKAVKKTAKKAAAPKASVTIEFGDKQVKATDILKNAQKAYKKNHRGETIKTIDIYVKPEENAAYYVVNGEGSPDFRIDL